MSRVLTVELGIEPNVLGAYLPAIANVDEPLDGHIFRLPQKYQGMPQKLIPLYAKDSLGQNENGLIRISNDAWQTVDDFATAPTKENLEAMLYVLLANEHYGYYPWFKMEDFRKAVGRFPDCGFIYSRLQEVLENRGCKVDSLWFVNGSEDAQFTTIIKTPCGKYFACDQAAWYYGPEGYPWYYVMESKDVMDAIDKLKDYFLNTARKNPDLKNKDWHLLNGVEKEAILWIEDQDRLIAKTANDITRSRFAL